MSVRGSVGSRRKRILKGSPAILMVWKIDVWTGLSFHSEELLYPQHREKVPVLCWRGAYASPPLLVGIFRAEVANRTIDG